jgi:Flp pilus assembly protein TadD
LAVQRAMAAAQAIEAGRADEAASALAPVIERFHQHPEVLRLHAGIASLYGDHDEALAAMGVALAARPADALYHNTHGSLLATAGRFDEAARAFAEASRLDPNLAGAWYNLGVLLVRSMRNDEAVEPLRRAIALEPTNFNARTQLADLLRTQGRAEEAASAYRDVLAQSPRTGMAWWGLADLRTGQLGTEDAHTLQNLLAEPNLSPREAVPMGFALARALDEQAHYAQALAALAHANATARRIAQWDGAAFSRSIDALDRAFAHVAPTPGDAGRNVIFVVSLPRSGSTLIEQILASHPDVEGAGELPDLPLVLSAESRRRGQPLHAWAANASAQDWQRLGAEYLGRTARWTQRRRVFVDKLPSNWHYIDAIRAMLPDARIVVAQRDALETCFSCYRQYLQDNEYTRTFADLATHWRDFDRYAGSARARHPGHVTPLALEHLVAEPEASIRALLAFCQLPFDAACLEFHRTERDVRSPSAMQVRAPLRDTAHAPRYGALLDPLRAELGLAPFDVPVAR